MSYYMDFDGLRQNICTLAAWMLSYEGAEHLKGDKVLLENIKKYHRFQVSSLLLSTAVHLRTIKEVVKDKKSKHQGAICAEVFVGEITSKALSTGVWCDGEKENATFEVVLNKIIHASQIGPQLVSDQLLIDLVNYKEKWALRMHVVKFCSIALKFLNDRQDYYKEKIGQR